VINLSLKSNTIWSFSENILRQVFSLIVFLITAKFVPKEAFGTIALCFALIEAMKIIFVDSLARAFISKKDFNKDDYNTLFSLFLVISLVIPLLIFCAVELIAYIFEEQSLKEALPYFCIIFALLSLSKVQEVWLQKHFKFKILAIRSVISIIVGGAIGIYLAINQYGIWALIIQHLTTYTIALILIYLGINESPKLKLSKNSVSDVKMDIYNLVFLSFVNVFASKGDIFVISKFLGVDATAIYSISQRISFALSSMLSLSIKRIYIPYITNKYNNFEEQRSTYLNSIRLSNTLLCPAFLGMAYISTDLISLLIGEKWGEAGKITSLLCCLYYIYSILSFNEQILIINKLSNKLRLYNNYNALINFTIILIFSMYGLEEIILALILRHTILPITTIAVINLLNISILEYIKSLLPGVLSVFLMLIIMEFSISTIQIKDKYLLIFSNILLGLFVYIFLISIFDNKIRNTYFKNIINIIEKIK
jgi:lipopolysaccharide exporter